MLVQQLPDPIDPRERADQNAGEDLDTQNVSNEDLNETFDDVEEEDVAAGDEIADDEA